MKRPRFFCENCGAEASLHAKTCSRCGRSFASVRCPSCGFTGEEDFFTGGCPVCGYSAAKSAPPEEPKVPAGALPGWVYLITALALAGAGAAILIAGGF